MFRRTFVHPETNNQELGGAGPRDTRYFLRQRGLRIENDGPPPAGVTRLPGQGNAGLRGLFDGQVTNQIERQQQQRRRPSATESMNKYLQYGGLDQDDR
jgi:hypothetical protein